MANNLIVTYDLSQPGQNYDDLIEAIKNLGNEIKINQSVWYVNSTLTAKEARNVLKVYCDTNDKLFVVDATNNSSAWEGLSDAVSDHLKKNWNK